MLVNDPPVPDPNNPAELDPKTFGGRAMTYYGRWTYKFEKAAELGAAKLVYLTDVEGLYRDLGDQDSLVDRVSVAGLHELIDSGSVSQGMLPKLRSCIDAVEAGVGRAHILDGRVPHALLLEFFTREGIGTMITHHAPDGIES